MPRHRRIAILETSNKSCMNWGITMKEECGQASSYETILGQSYTSNLLYNQRTSSGCNTSILKIYETTRWMIKHHLKSNIAIQWQTVCTCMSPRSRRTKIISSSICLYLPGQILRMYYHRRARRCVLCFDHHEQQERTLFSWCLPCEC